MQTSEDLKDLALQRLNDALTRTNTEIDFNLFPRLVCLGFMLGAITRLWERHGTFPIIEMHLVGDIVVIQHEHGDRYVDTPVPFEEIKALLSISSEPALN